MESLATPRYQTGARPDVWHLGDRWCTASWTAAHLCNKTALPSQVD